MEGVVEKGSAKAGSCLLGVKSRRRDRVVKERLEWEEEHNDRKEVLSIPVQVLQRELLCDCVFALCVKSREPKRAM